MALADDKTRAAAHGHLGAIHLACGTLAEAIRHLETARQAAPMWSAVLRLLTEAHRHLGNLRRCEELQRAEARQQQAGARLAQQIAGGPSDRPVKLPAT